LLTVLLTLSLG